MGAAGLGAGRAGLVGQDLPGIISRATPTPPTASQLPLPLLPQWGLEMGKRLSYTRAHNSFDSNGPFARQPGPGTYGGLTEPWQ